MKIAIDACGYKSGGISRYISNLALGLDSSSNFKTTILRDYQDIKESIVPDVGSTLYVNRSNNNKLYTVDWYERNIQQILTNLDISLFHGTAYAFPNLDHIPCVVTIHDLIFYHLKESYGSLFKFYDYWVEKAKAENKQVITVSNFSKRELVEMAGFNEDLISVIPLGIDLNKYKLTSKENKEYIGYTPYLLHVGKICKNKNQIILIDSIARLNTKGYKLNVILIDHTYNKREHQIIMNHAKKLGVSDQIFILNKVSDQQLQSFYSLAEVFTFPSLFEGFGLPPLEAMACGTPVVCSNKASLPEVVGDGAICVNPVDIEEISESIIRILSDTNFKNDLIRKGEKQVQKFTWETCVNSTINLYRDIVAINS
ncbi:glycosyltransferase family 4 protein [Metabacillus halosaccharovorans]|uniref:glycosyltransferase family 4 protein n=1 Tax=Metabacillus halosaccharovorans TaxID=930124 RepID=UPI001C1FF865|nr:glycosyltransferase family 1 protein [Metabacillus halosaccharovorans]MBU7595711.1 glycosyltransferase family 4 protein [Metabacillus halosaccharovorans]